MVESNRDEERLAHIDHLVETLQREIAALRIDTAVLAATSAEVTREPHPRRRKTDASGRRKR